MSKKQIFRLTVLIAFFFAVGFAYEYHLPQIESFLLLKLEEIASRKAPAQVLPARLKLSLIPLGITLEDVRIIPKKPLSQTLAPTTLKELAFSINIWSLIRGDFRLSRVVLRDSVITLFLKDDPKKTSKSNFKFEMLNDIPIDEIELENMTVLGRVDPQRLVFKITDLDLNVVNLFNSLYVYFGSPNIFIKPAGPYATIQLEIQARGLMESQELRISALKIKSEDSFLVASGLLNGDLLGGNFENGRLSFRSHLDLANIDSWAQVFPKAPKLPKFQGVADLNSEVAYHGSAKNPDINLQVETRDLKFDKFFFGKIKTEATGNLNQISINELKIENQAGLFGLKKVKLNLKPDVHFEGDVDVQKLELSELLVTLGLKRIPVHLDLKSSFPCKGDLTPQLLISCDGEIFGSNLDVKTKSRSKTLMQAKQFSASGHVEVDQQKVKYSAEAKMGTSSGRSSGVIDYDKGFQIDFQGDQVNFSDLTSLVEMKFEGQAQVKGSTEGDADRATTQMSVTTKNFWFEDYGIGEMSTNLSYKKGHLYLREVEGHYGNSRYSADLDIDLDEKQLLAQGKMPFVDLKDMKEILYRRLPIPVFLSGTGTGEFKAWGPLAVEKLNYTLRSQFFRGQVAFEEFDVAHFDVDGVDGVANAKRLSMTKANGRLDMTGFIKPMWSIDAVVVGRNLRLEQSNLVTSMGLDVQGQSDFNFTLRGPLRRPQMELNGRFSRVIIGDIPQEDSSFRMNISSTQLSGTGQFLGNKITSQFSIPIEPKTPFLFNLRTQKWDFTSLFALFSKSSSSIEFQTSLSMEAKLQAPEGGFWNSSGSVDVQELRLRHGAQSMENSGVMRLNFNKGVVNSTDNFGISSGENYLKLAVANLSQKHLNASLNGKMDLSLLGFLTPFISDLRGVISLSVDLRGTWAEPQISGSTFLDKAYVKLKEFPHPFTNIRADMLFNQQTLMINGFRTEMGGGKINGDGRMSFIARDNVPVDIKASVSDVTVNIPDGFRTSGSGQVSIEGNKFPYLMNINYEIASGDVTAEFTGGTSTSEIKASPYLPKFVQQEIFSPFRFILDAKLLKPVNVNNTYMKAMVQGHARVKGTPDHLVVDGNLSLIPGSKVFFRDAPFDVTTGYVEYNDFPPDNPRIYLTATTQAKQIVTDQQHVTDSNVGSTATPPRQVENSYDINLLVQGRAKPAPQFTLTSQPPLSQREIVSLLALGMTPDALDEKRSSSTQAANTAIGAAILQQPVGKKLKDSLGVDVKVSSGPTTSSASSAVASSDATGPAVTLSKQWTPKFSASASSTIGSAQTNGVKLEYKVNKSVSVVGSWEEKATTTIQDKKDASSDVFGLDLEYKMQFK